MGLIHPQWPAPSRVRAIFTNRQDGVSTGVYAGLNLGAHVADDPAHVAENRRQLTASLQLPQEPIWLEQVHGVDVYRIDSAEQAQPAVPPTADAAVTQREGVPLTVMTADCLPLLLCDQAGSVIATAHAGWRGLCDGVIEQTVAAMQVPVAEILVWLGPAIGPTAFEVGSEVRAAFLAQDAAAEQAFVASSVSGKWLADLFLLARLRLARLGITQIYGGDECTYRNQEQFYSYRRDGQTGRMSGVIWLMPQN